MASWMCGDKIAQVMAHHESVTALWDHEWKRKCAMNIYPFHFCRLEDMQVIIDELAAKGIHDAYDDAWTRTFLPHVLRLEAEGQKAEAEGDHEAAKDYYLRGTTIGMIARFPIINSPVKREAWAIQKRLYLRGTSFWEAPVQNVYVAHTHAAGTDGPTLQVFLRRPPLGASSRRRRAPVLLVLTGLDGYRTDHVPAMADHAVALGFAVLLMEIPGTGDAPGDARDPASVDRMLDSLLDWVAAQAGLDADAVLVWGTSTGGFYAMRAAHTHHDRVRLAIAQGGACDLALSREWLDKVDGGEYSFSLTKALMHKFGYTSMEEFKANVQDKFSLVKTGIFDGPCTRLILINGVNDTIFPIEDTIAPTKYGPPKELRLVPDRPHMGEPQSAQIVKKAFADFASECSNAAAAWED